MDAIVEYQARIERYLMRAATYESEGDSLKASQMLTVAERTEQTMLLYAAQRNIPL